MQTTGVHGLGFAELGAPRSRSPVCKDLQACPLLRTGVKGCCPDFTFGSPPQAPPRARGRCRGGQLGLKLWQCWKRPGVGGGLPLRAPLARPSASGWLFRTREQRKASLREARDRSLSPRVARSRPPGACGQLGRASQLPDCGGWAWGLPGEKGRSPGGGAAPGVLGQAGKKL